MVFLVALALMQGDSSDAPQRTPSIYRCPAKEAESDFFGKLLEEEEFDRICVDPQPGARALAEAKGKVRFVTPGSIDTKANLAWRNLTIDFANGKISPKTWLERTKSLKETVHFLSSPKTAKLRDATGQKTRTAVFAEMLLLSWKGVPCFTADDIWQTRYFPGPGALESWILAMNDYRGPMLYGRYRNPALVSHAPTVLRADAKPGLLIFRQPFKKGWETFYLNNGAELIELPSFTLDQVSIAIGLDLEGPKPRLQSGGFFIVEPKGE